MRSNSLSVIVRPLASQDYPQTIKAIQRSITLSWQKIRPAKLLEAFCQKYVLSKFKEKVKDGQYWVALDEDTGRVIGVIGLKNNQLRTFFVDPDYQRQGVGRKLYDCLEQEAKKQGLRELILEGSPLGEPAYLSFGFRKVKIIRKERLGISYTDAVMKKTLV